MTTVGTTASNVPPNTVYFINASNWIYCDEVSSPFWENHEWCPNTQRWVDKDLVIDEGL